MTTFGMYGGKKFQDKQREELLSLLDAMIHGDEAGTVTMAGTVLFFYERMSQFKDRLDFIISACLQILDIRTIKYLCGCV
jgi:3-polyprenyl-4-hydroxybenzoate decarboxylase